MNREEVVKWLESLKKEVGKAENRTLWHYAESIDIVIKALKVSEIPTGSDLISRQDAINTIRREVFWCDDLIDEIKALPSAEPKTGRWAWDDKGYFYCNRCGKKPDDQTRTTDYCPYCGADMGGKKSDD